MQQGAVLTGLQAFLDLLHPGFTGKNRRKGLPDLLLHGDFPLRKADLVQEADSLLPCHGDTAFLVAVQVIHADIPVNQLQQGGFAAAVPPCHRDFLIVADFKVYILQYGIRAVLYQRMPDLISHEVLPSLTDSSMVLLFIFPGKPSAPYRKPPRPCSPGGTASSASPVFRQHTPYQ